MSSESSLATPLSSSASRTAININYAGGGLIALAFALPFLAIPAGLGTSFQAGGQTVDTLVALLVLAIISWAITRKRSDLAKASGRLISGGVLCLMVGTGLAQAASEEQASKRFLRDAMALQAAQSAKFVDLGQRFDKINLTTVLTPEAMTTVSGLATARATIAQYRALLAERRLLLQTYLAEFERFFATIPPGDMRNGALSAMSGGSKDATAKVYADLDRSQTALTDSMSAVLDWGAAQAGALGVRTGQLLFSTKEQQAELQTLLAKLGDVEVQNAAVLKSAAVMMTEAQAVVVDNIRQAEQILRK